MDEDEPGVSVAADVLAGRGDKGDIGGALNISSCEDNPSLQTGDAGSEDSCAHELLCEADRVDGVRKKVESEDCDDAQTDPNPEEASSASTAGSPSPHL